MSSPDPTIPTTPGGPPPPAKSPGPVNPLNPALLANVSVIGSFALALAALIVMCILAIVYDGSYAQALLQVAETIVYGSIGIGGATSLTHVLRRSQ